VFCVHDFRCFVRDSIKVTVYVSEKRDLSFEKGRDVYARCYVQTGCGSSNIVLSSSHHEELYWSEAAGIQVVPMLSGLKCLRLILLNTFNFGTCTKEHLQFSIV
jgi:hypothetical protein